MILYEDKELIVCHKPAGIPVQSARVGQKDMVSILNNYLAEHGKNAGAEQIRVVHRLDQPVEGVIVFAKTKRAAAGLTRQITEGSMRKVYRAVCCVDNDARERYVCGQERYTLVDYLVKDGRTNTSSVARQGDRDAKRAELSFSILAVREHLALAEIELMTGRHHQIRVQMAHAGLPLYGDQKYHPDWKKYVSVDKDREAECGGYAAEMRTQLALCAVSLGFRHPVSGKKMEFTVEPEGEIFRF